MTENSSVITCFGRVSIHFVSLTKYFGVLGEPIKLVLLNTAIGTLFDYRFTETITDPEIFLL